MAKVTVGMKTETLQRNIDAQDNRYRRAITGVMKYYRGVMTSDAKENAPWTDDTGAARSGLHTDLEIPDQNTWNLILAHGVFYGFYLETRWLGAASGHPYGKYAIVMPTIDKFGPIIMAQIGQAIANVQGGTGASVWERELPDE